MTAWVLLRGLTRESRHWGDFPGVLAQAFRGDELLVADLPGNGVLHDQRSPDRVEDMVESYRDRLQATGAAPPYRLLALSLGAMVAVAWAHRHADEVAALVLINTSLRPLNPWYRRLRLGSYADLLRLAFRSDDQARERIILARTSRLREGDAALAASWAEFRRQCPVSRANALRQLGAAWRYRAPAGPPPVPTLILAGARDRLVDPRCSRQLAQRWKVPLMVHPMAGHDLPLDDPDWVAERVRGWLTG